MKRSSGRLKTKGYKGYLVGKIGFGEKLNMAGGGEKGRYYG